METNQSPSFGTLCQECPVIAKGDDGVYRASAGGAPLQRDDEERIALSRLRAVGRRSLRGACAPWPARAAAGAMGTAPPAQERADLLVRRVCVAASPRRGTVPLAGRTGVPADDARRDA